MYVRICIHTYARMYIHMYVCTYVRTRTHTNTDRPTAQVVVLNVEFVMKRAKLQYEIKSNQ